MLAMGRAGSHGGIFVCMIRTVGSYTKINTKWFQKSLPSLIFILKNDEQNKMDVQCDTGLG
jgi:hypothetical protein